MLNINLSGELQAKAEQLAQSKGWSLDELIGKAVENFVQEEAPGESLAIVSLEEVLNTAPKTGMQPKPPLKLNVHAWSSYPAESSFRREEIYDDNGR